MLKYKTQSIISILGLTIGVVFFAYGYHWYKFETTFDGFYPNSENIYYMYGVHKSSNKTYNDGFLAKIAIETIKKEFPEIESVGIKLGNYGSNIKYGDIDLKYPKTIFSDESFFKMFPQEVVAGSIDLESIKMDLNIFISESFARKVFAHPDSAIGKVLMSGYDRPYNIQAVVKDAPPNSIFKADMFIKDEMFHETYRSLDELTQWRDLRDAKPFVMLHPNTDINKFKAKLKTFAIDNKYNEDMLLEITPLSDVRYNDPIYYKDITFDKSYIRTFILVSILLIISALFNYLNILVKNTTLRVQEINLRRVSGASVNKVFFQLFVEISLLMLFVSLLSFFLIELSINTFKQVFDTTIISSDINIILLITIISVSTILIISVYLILYRFIKRTSFIKHFSGNRHLIYIRAALVLQLIIGIFFIMSSLVFYSQSRYMSNADMGIKTDDVLQVTMNVNQRTEFMEHVSKLSMVESIIESDYFSIRENIEEASSMVVTDVEWANKGINQNPVFQIVGLGLNFFDELGANIIDGRGFIPEDFIRLRGQGTDKIIINQSAVQLFNMDNPIGEKIAIPSNSYSSEHGRLKNEFEIIGIVENFHTLGMKSEIPPLLIKGHKANYEGYINYVKVAPGMDNQTIKAINEIIPKYDPDEEGEEIVKTMSSIVKDLSKKERELLKLFFTVSFLCILIAIFGIYSVSQQETQRRRKEIAIRKTAGAKTKEIMNLFFREYLSITLIASAIALPLAWLFMNRWLQTFAYHISISWWMFAIVILAVSAIVILTIFSQVYRASNQNPAEVVKSE